MFFLFPIKKENKMDRPSNSKLFNEKHLFTKNAYSDRGILARPLDWIKLATVSGRSKRITRQHVWMSSPSSPTLVATKRFNWQFSIRGIKRLNNWHQAADNREETTARQLDVQTASKFQLFDHIILKMQLFVPFQEFFYIVTFSVCIYGLQLL